MLEKTLDPELVERVNRELAMYGQLTAGTAQELRAAQTGIQNFNAKINAAGGAISALTGAFVTYNREVFNGSSANQAAAASMDKLAEAAKFAGVGLALLMPGGVVVKALVAGLGLLTAKVIETSKVLAEYTQDVTKVYQDLARAGAAGAGGMKDAENAIHNLGINVKKADAVLRLMAENSVDMALFGSTVLRGRQVFERTMSSLTAEQRVNMEMMGLDRDAQAEATLGYIKQQRMLIAGTREQMNTSSAAVMRYVQETDLLTRITGLNRKEQEKLVEEAMRNEAYNATLQQIREEQGEAAAQQVQNALIMARKAGPETAKQFMDSISGFVGASDESRKMMLATGGVIADVTERFRSGQIRDMRQTAGAMHEVFRALGENARQFRVQAQMMNYGPNFGSLYEHTNAARVSLEGLEQSVVDAAKAEQAAQMADQMTRKQMENENRVRETAILQQKTLSFAMRAYIDTQVIVTSNNLKLAQAAYNAAKALADLSGKPIETGAEGQARAAHETATEAAAVAADRVRELAADPTATPQQRTAAEVEAERLLLASNETARALHQAALEARNERRRARTDNPFDRMDREMGAAMRNAMAAQTRLAQGLPAAETQATESTQARETAENKLKEAATLRESLTTEIDNLKKQLDQAKINKDQKEIDRLDDEIKGLNARRQQARIDEFNARRQADQARREEETVRRRLQLMREQQSRAPVQPAQPAQPSVPAAPAQPPAPAEPAGAAPAQPPAGQESGGSRSMPAPAQPGAPLVPPAPRSQTLILPQAQGLQMPGTRAASGMGQAQGVQITNQDELSRMGLRIKTGDVQADNTGISPRLIELAKAIQNSIPTFSYFSAFNDRFHQEKAPTSNHTKGLALDFAVAPKPTVEDGRAITDWLKSAGASLAIDEYNNPGAMTTAGHIHAEIPKFEQGGSLGEGRIGIAGEAGKPELVTGPADITPMNDLMRAFGNMTSLLEISVGKLDAIARATAATSDTSARMLNYAQN